MYDLLVATPHVPDDAVFTAAEFALYRQGYHWALVMALRTLKAAEERHKLFARTRRLEAQRRREESRGR